MSQITPDVSHEIVTLEPGQTQVIAFNVFAGLQKEIRILSVSARIQHTYSPTKLIWYGMVWFGME